MLCSLPPWALPACCGANYCHAQAWCARCLDTAKRRRQVRVLRAWGHALLVQQDWQERKRRGALM